jgi:TolB-like protein
MLAMLPFQNMSNDPTQEHFSDGLTEETVTDLGQLRPEQLGVIARRKLRREGGGARVSAQPIRVSDQTHLWAQNYERVHDLLLIENELGKAIARQVQINLAPQQEIDLSQMRTVNPDVYIST